MKLPYSWLKEYTDIAETPRDYSHRMTMSGSKVESWASPADNISSVVCGKITAVEKHRDSDHLHICMLDIGKAEALQIVSGAPNLRVGDLVPVAVDGAMLPAGEIRTTVMRGVQSYGMLCSFSELGLTHNDCPYADPEGILVFPTEMNAKPGDCAITLLGLDDTVIEFEITPNRPDCLSIIGLARETSATYGVPLKLASPELCETAGDIRQHLEVEIADSGLCPRYTAGMAANINIQPSPQWMRDRLRGAGIRPINNIVDITNYVMLEYGQPMHAFDYSCIEGKKIIVRTSTPGETTVTLDGQTRTLADNTLLITDPVKSIGIAGVMGGENSEITENTRMIVFESACFSGPAVRSASRKIGMRTEASSRFEKGLDAENTVPALMRALQLVQQLGAGDVLGGVIDVYPAPKQHRKITLDCGYINRILGTNIAESRMGEILASLGFAIEGTEVSVPTWRDDVEGRADLAEEVGRIYGFDNIESTSFASRAVIGGFTPRQTLERTLASACHANGFYESRSVSFMGPKDLDKINTPGDSPLRNAVRVLNPLGADQSLMRTTMLPAMLEAAARNINFRQPELRLFESAMVYLPVMKGGTVDTAALPQERKTLAMAMYGPNDDYFSLKGCVENILAAARAEGCRFMPCKDNPAYHPGRAAEIYCGEARIGVIGQVHPAVMENYGTEAQVYAAELDVDAVYASRKEARAYTPLPRYPAVTRDIAVVCDRDIYVSTLEECVRKHSGGLLTELELFDVYTGAQVPQGKKSVAFALTFRSPDHTLNDKEIDKLMSGILGALHEDCGAVLRE